MKSTNSSPKFWRIGGIYGGPYRNLWQSTMQPLSCATVGYPAIGSLATFTSPYQVHSALIKNYPQVKSKPTWAEQEARSLYDFAKSIQKQDMMVVMHGSTVLGLGKVTSDYYYEPSSDCPNRRTVEWTYKSKDRSWKLLEPADKWRLVGPITAASNIQELLDSPI